VLREDLLLLHSQQRPRLCMLSLTVRFPVVKLACAGMIFKNSVL